MNLGFVQLIKITAGAVAFWALSFLVLDGTFGIYQDILGTQNLGWVSGTILGAAVTIVGLVIQDSHRTDTGPAANFSMINGMGSMLIGKLDVREDGSYITTEWFCLAWLPVFPVCNYRLVKVAGRSLIVVSSALYDIREKHPVRFSDVAKGYGITVLILTFVGIAVLLANSWAQ